MIEREVDVATRDGAMNTFIVHPEEDGPHPLVLFLMDAPGKREELHDMAKDRKNKQAFLCCRA